MDEENELEEGEAWSGREDDSCIDPDAFSYIDKKIQDVLGHFQKDFEAGLSAENLGAKFGGYGSFLPTYQRSPLILSQPRSAQDVPSQNVTKSPYNPSVKVTNPNVSVTMSASCLKNNSVMVPPVDNSCKRDMCVNEPYIQESNSQHTSLDKPSNITDQKPLKVRIKVGSDNTLARNNVTIYSTLGLDLSSPSSFEDSPHGSIGISSEFQDLPDESPKTIFQVMTCFVVPGGLLLSPLQESLFQLVLKDNSFVNKGKRGMLFQGTPEMNSDFAYYSTCSREVKGQMEQQTKSSEHKGRPRVIKNADGKNDVNLIREIDIETQGGQELAPSSISNNADRKAERLMVGNTAKDDTKMLDHQWKMNEASLKGISTFPGAVDDKPYDLIESTTNNEITNSGNEITCSRGKLNLRASRTEKKLEEQNSNKQKNDNSELQKEVRRKVDKDFGPYSNGQKRRNGQITEPADHIESNSFPHKEKAMGRKDQISDGKKKPKSRINFRSSGEFLKDNISGSSSAALKERKKNSHARTDHAEKKSNALKSHKQSSGASFREFHGNIKWDNKSEPSENEVGSQDFHSKRKGKSMKPKHEKSVVSTHTFKEKSGCKKVEETLTSGTFIDEPILTPLTCNVLATDATVAPPAPAIINDEWVCCDICGKWRLLPYETNPSDLPNTWQCNMLNWLPGMNSCEIGEEETTNALIALYLPLAPENGATLDGCHNVASSSTSFAGGLPLGQRIEVNIQNVHGTGKRKNTLKDASDMLSHSTPKCFPDTVNRGQLASVKCEISNEANKHHPVELNSMNKVGLVNESRSSDFNREKQKIKQKYKQKNLGFYSDEDDHGRQSEKHLKLKSKREVDQDDLGSSKKPRKEILQYSDKECSNHNLSMEAFEETGIGGCSTAGIATNESKQRKLPMPKDLKCDSDVNSAASSKRLRDEVQFNALYVDKSNNLDLSAKKRKVKEWQEGEPNHEALVTSQHLVENEVIVKGALSESKPVKNRKALLSIPEGEGSKATKLNSKMDQKGKLTRMALPTSIEHLPDRINRQASYTMVEEHRSNQSRGNSASPRNLEFNCLKGDMVHSQPLAAANSSSSKVSGSRKSRSNLKETKGSPIESVSSSPSRIPRIEKPSCKRILEQNVDVINAGFSVLRSPKGCADSEVNGGSAPSGNDRKERVFSLQHRGCKSDLGKSKLRISGSCKEMNLQSTKNSIGCRLEDSFGPCESEKGNTQEMDEKDILRKKDVTLKWMTVRQDNISTLTVQENMNANGTSQNEKALNHPCSDRINCGELPSELGRSQLKLTSGNEQETKSWGPPLVSSPLKASKTALEVVDAVSADVLNFVKQHKQPDIRNGLHHNNLRHAAPDGPDPSSPIRKENHSVMLKEARDLKHTANRLKSEGLELESTALYFEAAMKFLHVAALMEPINFDCAKQAEAGQMYFETAKLCKFVAHEYEKIKEMAATALAYKCVEVAYMKSAYSKRPNASKDLNELQAAFQFLPPGESPSSSASDVDNLNNQAILGKDASGKDGSSPQVAGNSVIAARHHQLMWLLRYINDINCAFEATRKSHIAFEAAIVSLQKDRVDGMSYVRKALDCNFYNIEGLLRLVRLSLESIGR
ncbi:unnamed protein product [Musa acuminata subsp. malaccensis]|uniref:(wild Malaysian banana) hypothetical protein n=1 Tax=Musa acuminata subsp. malaccensis TaxID=214687 RepID=A0A804K9M6_MUSAM|nr:PREDICTED: uncharacterized protein LOC103995350 isoform X2 [Musa acuminata subsp. malaccensis]CAG1832424.1 unnamed protein product [Musa acuminata subsp. malaccensis]